METKPCINNTSSSNIDNDEYDVDITVDRFMGHASPVHGHPFTWLAELLRTGYFDASIVDGSIEYSCEYSAIDNAEIVRQARAWYDANPETVAEYAIAPLNLS